MIASAWICLLAPLAGALVITLAGMNISKRTAAWISALSTMVAFGGALSTFIQLWGRDADDRIVLSTAWTWLGGASFHAGLSILIDPLSVFMMLIVSGVGSLIVLYSIGYMDGDN